MRLTSSQKILWALVGVAAATFAGLWLLTEYGVDRAAEGESALRAKFELTDHTGTVRTEADFSGKWMLIFFGFANCPDICPTTLSEVAAVMDGLGADADKVQPLFVSIDPERDTPEALADFVPRFDPRIIGLTGTPEQIAETAETFPIFYERIEDASAPDAYTMSHTSHLFLFGPDAGFVDSWPYGTPAKEILADLRERL